MTAFKTLSTTVEAYGKKGITDHRRKQLGAELLQAFEDGKLLDWQFLRLSDYLRHLPRAPKTIRAVQAPGVQADKVFTYEEDLNLKVIPGSNEGCYIDLCIADKVLMSYRYASLSAGSKEIKKELQAIMAQWGGDMPVAYM